MRRRILVTLLPAILMTGVAFWPTKPRFLAVTWLWVCFQQTKSTRDDILAGFIVIPFLKKSCLQHVRMSLKADLVSWRMVFRE